MAKWNCRDCGDVEPEVINGVPAHLCHHVFQWDCPDCAEPLVSTRREDVGGLCGYWYCKHNGGWENDYYEDEYTRYDADLDATWEEKQRLEDELYYYPEGCLYY